MINKITFHLLLSTALSCLSSSFAQFTMASGTVIHVSNGVTVVSHYAVKYQDGFNADAIFSLEILALPL